MYTHTYTYTYTSDTFTQRKRKIYHHLVLEKNTRQLLRNTLVILHTHIHHLQARGTGSKKTSLRDQYLIVLLSFPFLSPSQDAFLGQKGEKLKESTFSREEWAFSSPQTTADH